MRYSHGASSPVRTRSRERLDDVGLRRDRVGADHLRPAERDRLGDRPRALELPKHGPAPELARHVLVARPRPRRRCRSPTVAGERSRIAAATASSETSAGERGEAAEQGGVRAAGGRGARARARWPARSAARSGGSRSTNSPSPSSSKRARGVDRARSRRRRRPPKTSTWCSSVGSWMISASGSAIGSRSADRPVVDAAERRRPARRCARSRSSGTPARGGPRRTRRPRAARRR